jgi:hypothetical protein
MNPAGTKHVNWGKGKASSKKSCHKSIQKLYFTKWLLKGQSRFLQLKNIGSKKL